MNGIPILLIGIVIINVILSLLRSIQKGKQAKTGIPPKKKVTKDLLREFLEEEDLLKKVSTGIEGLEESRVERPPQETARKETEFIAPEAGEMSGIEERREEWREDTFEAKEQEAPPKEPTTWDAIPSYDELYREGEMSVSPEEAPKPLKKPKQIAARKAMKAKARKMEERVESLREEEPAKRREETIFDSLKEKSSLQRAIVLSEVLGPCMAKRRRYRRF